MAQILIVTEKRSVGEDIAAIVGAKTKGKGHISGNNYVVTWCRGHLVSNAKPEEYNPALSKWSLDTLPIIPETWHTTVLEGSADQYYIVEQLMNAKDIESIICAGDTGREGELIFRMVYDHAKCKKPVKRLWVNSLEEAELKRGLENLQDNREYDNLYQSALCRSQADWLIGINFTRLYTARYHHKLTVGRVQTPTVALIVKRQKEIENFIPQPYWRITADCGTFKAYLTVNDKKSAGKIVLESNHKPAYVSRIRAEDQQVHSPKLYTITTLQRDANKLLGYTANETLECAQRLYENKFTTYPRTESEFLPSSLAAALPGRLDSILTFVSNEMRNTFSNQPANFEKVIDDTKIEDHYAIIPTGMHPAGLDEKDENIFMLICYRFLAAISPSFQYQQTTVLLDIEGNAFEATGKKAINLGFQAVIFDLKKTLKKLALEDAESDEDMDDKTSSIPVDLQEGQQIDDVDVFSVEKKTQKPRPYTEDTLLGVMKNISSVIPDETLKSAVKERGLGTGATRANIIETIIKNGYVERNSKQLLPTEAGKSLIQVVMEKLKEPEMTAEWEEKLELIAKGTFTAQQFIADIQDFVSKEVEAYKLIEKVDPHTETLFKSDKEVIGVCPRCGKNVLEGNLNFYCEAGRDTCGFTMWKNDRFFLDKKKELTGKMAATLLEKGNVKVTGLYSAKTGNKYDAVITLEDTGKYINYKLQF